MALLSWDLVSPVSYDTSQELSFNLHFEAPANTGAKKFYLMGALYTPDGTYISGTLFGILKAAEVDYGVNDATYISLWELEPEEAVDLPCRFILNRTNCLLALFLMRMVGDEPSIDNDEVVAQIQAQLTAPQTVWEQIQDVIGQNVMPLAAMGLMLGMVALVGREIVKEVR